MNATPEELFKSLKNVKNSKDSNLKDSFKNALKCCFVEKFDSGYDRPCEDNDFSEFKKFNETNIFFMNLIIEDLVETDYFSKEEINPLMDTNLLATILIVCGENINLKPWNTEKTVRNCELILIKLLKLFGSYDVPNLMLKNNRKKLLKNILQVIRPKLLSETWKYFPAAVTSYHWILKMITQPELACHLSSVLPTALLLVDDFVNQNRIVGIKCLDHIINNLTLAELQFHGHGDVIYNALMPLIRIREPELLNEVMPCLVNLTSKMEFDLGRKNITKWSRFDNIYEIYLENMELETLIELRDCFIKNLILLLNASDLQIVRWSKRLLRIFKEYIETAGRNNDDRTTNCCLKVIEKYVEVTKPASALYAKNLLFILLIALYNSTTQQREEQKENQEIAFRTIKMLNPLSETDKQEFRIALKSNSIQNLNFCNFIEQTFNSD